MGGSYAEMHPLTELERIRGKPTKLKLCVIPFSFQYDVRNDGKLLLTLSNKCFSRKSTPQLWVFFQRASTTCLAFRADFISKRLRDIFFFDVGNVFAEGGGVVRNSMDYLAGWLCMYASLF